MAFFKQVLLLAVTLSVARTAQGLPLMHRAGEPSIGQDDLFKRGMALSSWGSGSLSFGQAFKGSTTSAGGMLPKLDRTQSQLVVKQYEGVSGRQNRSQLSLAPAGAKLEHERGFVGARPPKFYKVGGQVYAASAVKSGLAKPVKSVP